VNPFAQITQPDSESDGRDSNSNTKRAGARRLAEMEVKADHLESPRNVTPELIAHLAEKFSPELIAKKLEALLNATHVTAGGKVIDDNRAQEAGLKLLLAYLVGLPIQRQEIINVHVAGMQELTDKAMASPALQSLAQRLVDTSSKKPDSRRIQNVKARLA
jgi:hypothetical protein